MRRLVETAVCIVAALLLVGTWLVEPYSVVSGSMHPTLHGPHRAFDCPHCLQAVTTAADFAPIPDRPAYCPRCKRPGPIEDRLPIIPGDGLLVDRTAFWYRTPRRGEIVAFRLPAEAKKVAVKRIIGLPNETIEIRHGQIFADGLRIATPVDEDFTPPAWYDGTTRWTLGPDEYFALGDNPGLSDDSRTWPQGPGVSAQLIIGKPFIVHAPRRLAEPFGLRFHVPDITAIRYIR